MKDDSVCSRERPLVSIIIPSYNAEKFIEETIRSVIAQTYENWILFVIDDCSDDNTAAIVREMAEKDSRIHLLVNEKNMGAARTRNRGLDLCQGEYTALLDCDDLWMPDKLERQLQLAEKTHADLIYCSYRMINEKERQLWNDFLVPAETDFQHMLASSVISCSTALLTRKAVERYRFPVEYYNEDYAYWMMMLRDGIRACGVTDVLAVYRLREESRASDKALIARGRWEIYRKELHLSLLTSLVAFAQYGLNGIRKYKQVKGTRNRS